MVPNKKVLKRRYTFKDTNARRNAWTNAKIMLSTHSTREHNAAKKLQRHYRARLAIRKKKRDKELYQKMLHGLRESRKFMDRNYWRTVDLHQMSRSQLQEIAKRLDIPHLRKKHQIMSNIRAWIDLPSRVHETSIEAAAQAANKRMQENGSVYFWEAKANAVAINIRPLRGKGITKVAANFDSEAIYAIDERCGAVWLCRTSGMSGQVGFCSKVKDKENFGQPMIAQWLANPAKMNTLNADHVESVQVARNHAVATSQSGELFVWGSNPHGELGIETNLNEKIRPTIVESVENYTCIDAAVGTQHTLSICDDVHTEKGVMFAWGSNSHGQLGVQKNKTTIKTSESKTGAIEMSLLPIRILLPSTVLRKVSCGALHSMALSETGKLYSWGCNDGGRLGHSGPSGVPQVVKGFENMHVLEVSCGSWHTAAIVDHNGSGQGKVFTWGTGTSGQLGHGSCVTSHRPIPVSLPPMHTYAEPVIAVACGMYHTAALTEKYNVYSWGSKDSFLSLPTLLNRHSRSHGQISSHASTYDRDLQELNPKKDAKIPRLDLSVLPPPAIVSATALRLMPKVEQIERDRIIEEKMQAIEEIDLDKLAKPMCRLCWICDGYVPNPTKMWMCLSCKHNHSVHGKRTGPFSEYEAIRRLQGVYRAKRAREFLVQTVKNRYQRVYDIPTNKFFYYNQWNRQVSWERPKLIALDVELPIRDPDELPHVRPPLDENGAATIIQKQSRARIARFYTRSLVELRYIKQYNDKLGRYFYIDRRTKVANWKKCKLLKKRDDIGRFYQWKRPKKPSADQAAWLIQRCYRRFSTYKQTKRTINKRFIKSYDVTLKVVFYYDTKTGKRLPKAPWLFCEVLAEQLQSKKKTKIRNDDDAAIRLQNLFRRRKVRRRTRNQLSQRYIKHYDKAAKKHYYHDTYLDKTVWKKPKILRSPKRSEARNIRLRQIKATRHNAATKLQQMYRRRSARKNVLVLLNGIYEKRVDKKTGVEYYRNKKTGISTWDKPKLFGSSDLIKKEKIASRRCESKITSRDEAICVLQRFFRSRLLRQQLWNMTHDRIDRVYDPSTKGHFYFNKVTNESSWNKPRFYFEGPIRPHLQKVKIVDETSAAVAIQGVFRLRKARRLAQDLARNKYEKVWDESLRRFYYFDTLTGYSQWEKPKIFGFFDDIDTVINAKGEHVRHLEMSESEAVILVQCAFRARQAFKRSRSLMVENLEKHYDESEDEYYYFNKKTNQSTWNKPKLLGSYEMVEYTESFEYKNEIVSMIQRRYRKHRGMKVLRKMIADRFQKHYDTDNNAHFYYDTVRGESKWEKPMLLGSSDIPMK